MIKPASFALTLFLVQALNAGTQGKQSADRSVSVAKSVSIRKGVQGFPAILNYGRAAAVARINASLAEYDKKAMSAAEDCDGSLSSSGAKLDPGKENWTRTVEVTMHGPHYISYLVNDTYYCGGTHPDAGTFALVYDLQTGKLVDWTKLLSSATSQPETTADGSEVQTISSVSLTKLYAGKILTKVDKDCADAIRSEDFTFGFSLWPDAEAGSLVVHPNLDHAVAACGEDVSLNVEEQRGLGVAEEMIVAIEAAHAAVAILGIRPGPSGISVHSGSSAFGGG